MMNSGLGPRWDENKRAQSLVYGWSVNLPGASSWPLLQPAVRHETPGKQPSNALFSLPRTLMTCD